jgi:hypothetical protein
MPPRGPESTDRPIWFRQGPGIIARERHVADTLNANGAAALSISESLLLCLVDLQVLTEADVAGLLDDAAAAHRAPGKSPEETAHDSVAAALIVAIAAGKNAVRRRSQVERQKDASSDDAE